MIIAPLIAALTLLTHSGATIDRDVVASTMRTLTSEEFAGRLTLAPGAERASEFIASEMRRIGLRPGGEDGTYFHAFDVTVNQRPTKMNLLTAEADGKRVSLDMGKDFVPVFGSANERLVRGQAVFAGFGLKAGGWDDYAGLDAAGKVAIVLRATPEGAQPVSPGQRARWAKESGAVAILFVGPSAEGRSELPRPTRGQGVPADLDLVAAGVTRQAFESVTGLKFAEEVARKAPASRVLPVTLRVVTGQEANRGRSNNVIGVLPGNDPSLKNEVIVIGGHYDHLGWGEVGSRTGVESIHHGADDNASGTAGVLALAEAFAASKSNRRTLIFQAYCGEEVGLIGSAAWVRDNPELVKRTTLMVNLDMIGRLRETMTIFGCASAKELLDILKSVEDSGPKSVRVLASPPNSDHASFARAGVPVLFYHTNIPPEYHTEKDTFDLINLDGMVQVLESVRKTVAAVDARDQRLTFDPEAARVTGGGGPERPRRVRVGFIPDMGDEAGPGVRVSGVSPGSPAQQAGAKEGDRILKFGDREITKLEDLQQALMEAKPNVKVIVVILRGDQRLELEVIPTAPSG